MRSKHLIVLIAVFIFIPKANSQIFQPFPEQYNRLVQGISLSPNAKKMYFALPHKERLLAIGNAVADTTARLALYESKLEASGTWSAPKLFGFSGRFTDYEPTILPDGSAILFNSRRPLKPGDETSKNSIWMSRLQQGVWQEPQSLYRINSSEFEESYPTVSLTSKFIYCKEVEVNGEIQYHLFETIFQGTDTPKGKRIVFQGFNKESSDPHISADGNFLVFTAFKSGNWNETCDLYISFYKNESWSKPRLLTHLNSNGPDFAPFVSHDNEYIYYRKNFQYLKIPFKKILKDYF